MGWAARQNAKARVAGADFKGEPAKPELMTRYASNSEYLKARAIDPTPKIAYSDRRYAILGNGVWRRLPLVVAAAAALAVPRSVAARRGDAALTFLADPGENHDQA